MGGLFIDRAADEAEDEAVDESEDEAVDESEDESSDESADEAVDEPANKKELCPWGADRRWEIEAAAKYEAAQKKK
jgi:hypothetical protein